jgi:nitronate monooxygenase
MDLPKIIQGGMGVAISDWRLANAVATEGHMGVISGTGIAIMMAIRLQKGDLGGETRRALAHFPFQDVVQHIMDRYFVEGGIPEDQPFRRSQMWHIRPSQEIVELTVAANFVETWLAKEGHSNPIGINLLEKVQMPTMASLYGAMLAGVDFVLMGAGIPMQIPGILDKLAEHMATRYRIDVLGTTADYFLHFDPRAAFSGAIENLKRPLFLPIISSFVLAQALIKRATGAINGFIVETPVAGGHNAPPRGQIQYNEAGEPIYGDKDVVDLEKLKTLGLPFWLAGGYGNPEKFAEALEAGAAGIQVGTAFAYCNESGMDEVVKRDVIQKILNEEAYVHTSAIASPTGFPFKVVRAAGTLSDVEVYEKRQRVCDLGYLRSQYVKENGTLGYRCSAEPVDTFIKKGGTAEEAVGRACLCNALAATAGVGQRRKDGSVEPPIITSGDDIHGIKRFMKPGQIRYSAADVIRELERVVMGQPSQAATGAD